MSTESALMPEGRYPFAASVVERDRIGVCVVDSESLGSAYPRLGECSINAMAFVRGIRQVDLRLLAGFGAVLVGCSVAELEDAAFQAEVSRVTAAIPCIAITEPGANPATAAQLGFRGFVARDVTPDALDRTVRAVAGGEIAFPRSALSSIVRVLSAGSLRRALTGASAALTPRQQQIVELISEGATDREIATRLRISQSTAHKHVQNALRRSNARTRSQLVAVARQ